MSSHGVEITEGTLVAGRYRVLRRLREGGMGSVFVVRHVHTDQELAMKLLHTRIVNDEVALTRFRREARAPARVGSDHVVQVTDADVAPELGGVPFLVMELLRGQDFEDVLAGGRTLSASEAVLYLRQASRALDKAHALGIVHRDLKPENLFLSVREDGTPLLKILDFGIAKLGGVEEKLKATGTGQIFGTPIYMSPEQARADQDKIGPRSDVWAVGIIAHRMLVGHEPWTATTLTSLIAQIAFEPMPIPSQRGATLGAKFDAWFSICCARDPEGRFATVGEAVTALASALGVIEDQPVSRVPAKLELVTEEPRSALSATATAPLSRPIEPPARSSRLLFVVPIAALLLGAVGAFLLTSRRAPMPTTIGVEPKPSAIIVSPSSASIEAATVVTSVAAPLPTSSAVAVTPSASVAVSEPKRPPGVGRPAHNPDPTTTAQPAKTSAPVATSAPPPPDDPLGSRH